MGALTLLASGYDWIGQSNDGGPFQSLINMIQETGNAFYLLLLTVGIVAILICIVIAAIKVIAGGQRGREAGKADITWVLIGGVLLFSAVGIVLSLIKIGSTINEQITQQSSSVIRLIQSVAAMRV